MNKPIYLVTEEEKSKNGNKSTYSRRAYEDKCRAFRRINDAVNLDEYKDVEWYYDLEGRHSGEIRITGNGKFIMFRDDETARPEEGTVTITLEEVCLTAKNDPYANNIEV